MVRKQFIPYIVLTCGLCIITISTHTALFGKIGGMIPSSVEVARSGSSLPTSSADTVRIKPITSTVRSNPSSAAGTQEKVTIANSTAHPIERMITQARGKPTAPQPSGMVGSSTLGVTSPHSTPIIRPMEIGAWLYPGAPACLASTEISDGRKIAVLKAEYFTVQDSGSLAFLPETTAGCNGYSPKNVALLKQFSKSQYVTVSSASAGAMELFLKGDIPASVSTLATFIITNDLTGVELDYEDFGSWSGEQYTLYKQFVTALGNELHAKGKKLVIDGPAVANASEEGWFVWRYEDFTSLPVDQVVVMAYDHQFDTGAGSAISPFTWMEHVITWTLSKYPDKNKIVVGLPSYGYRGVEGTTKITIETYDQIAKESGFSTATRDPQSGEMTWHTGSTRYFYQDGESLKQKQALVEKLGLSSISVWHLGGNPWF